MNALSKIEKEEKLLADKFIDYIYDSNLSEKAKKEATALFIDYGIICRKLGIIEKSYAKGASND